MLDGRYARVRNRFLERSGTSQHRYTGPPTFDWNRHLRIDVTDRAFKDLMAYFHATSARLAFDDLLKTHSFTHPDGENWLKELSVVVDADGSWSNNCWWDGEERRIVCGESVDYVLDSLVTYHEYAHAVVESIAPGLFPIGGGLEPSIKERQERLLADAVCEGYADYLSCSLKNHPIVLEEWSDKARNLNESYRLSPSGDREPHRDSKSLSSGLWELRTEFTHRVTDRWIIQSLYRQRNRPQGSPWFTLREAANEAIAVDIEVFDGQHVPRMIEVFRARGIYQS